MIWSKKMNPAAGRPRPTGWDSLRKRNNAVYVPSSIIVAFAGDDRSIPLSADVRNILFPFSRRLNQLEVYPHSFKIRRRRRTPVGPLG